MTLREDAFKQLCVLMPWLDFYKRWLGPIKTWPERLEFTQTWPKGRRQFERIPLGQMVRPRGRHPNEPELTLHPALQTLANILGQEADDAFRAAYFPRMPDVNVSERHVRRVMAALQREVDGEAAARGKKPPAFTDLLWERQCALAERRRYWYGQYGITPQNYWRRTWSLWRVSEIEMPRR